MDSLFFAVFSAAYISQINGLRSKTGVEAQGWFVACPMTPQRLLTVPTRVAYRKIVRTGQLAQRLGAQILGWARSRTSSEMPV